MWLIIQEFSGDGCNRSNHTPPAPLSESITIGQMADLTHDELDLSQVMAYWRRRFAGRRETGSSLVLTTTANGSVRRPYSFCTPSAGHADNGADPGCCPVHMLVCVLMEREKERENGNENGTTEVHLYGISFTHLSMCVQLSILIHQTPTPCPSKYLATKILMWSSFQLNTPSGIFPSIQQQHTWDQWHTQPSLSCRLQLLHFVVVMRDLCWVYQQTAQYHAFYKSPWREVKCKLIHMTEYGDVCTWWALIIIIHCTCTCHADHQTSWSPPP